MVQPLKMLDKALIAVLIFQLVGCGTIFYPERRGQRGGHLDAGVVILDAIGLLFFIIPGIIAFAVDFSNGTIYIPETAIIVPGPRAGLRKIKFDPKTTSLAQIERIIKDETGRSVKLTQTNVRVSRMKSSDDMMVHFAQAQSDMQTDRLALNR